MIREAKLRPSQYIKNYVVREAKKLKIGSARTLDYKVEAIINLLDTSDFLHKTAFNLDQQEQTAFNKSKNVV